MDVLLVNAGSSSLKLSVLSEGGELRHVALAEWSGGTTRFQAGHASFEKLPGRSLAEVVRRAVQRWREAGWSESDLIAVAHRWVHGGPFVESAMVTTEVRRRLESLVSLAPLHHPPSLEALDAAAAAWPGIPQVVVFDTAFHATLSEEARTYAIPARWRDEFGIRRYGFHGLSYAYCARRAHQMLGATDARKLIVCHLGQGCSAAAIVGERCVETTMGFTPLEGLVMATRSGSVDPGILLYLQRQHGLTPSEIEQALNHQSGLLGLSGVSGDMRQVRAAADGGNEAARLALRVYTRRVRLAIGALAAALGGCDALVFTGGVGQNDARIRAEVCEGLSFLGVDLDDARNTSCMPDGDVARPASSARVLVIVAREDLTMLAEVRRLLGRSSDSARP